MSELSGVKVGKALPLHFKLWQSFFKLISSRNNSYLYPKPCVPLSHKKPISHLGRDWRQKKSKISKMPKVHITYKHPKITLKNSK